MQQQQQQQGTSLAHSETLSPSVAQQQLEQQQLERQQQRERASIEFSDASRSASVAASARDSIIFSDVGSKRCSMGRDSSDMDVGFMGVGMGMRASALQHSSGGSTNANTNANADADINTAAERRSRSPSAHGSKSGSATFRQSPLHAHVEASAVDRVRRSDQGSEGEYYGVGVPIVEEAAEEEEGADGMEGDDGPGLSMSTPTSPAAARKLFADAGDGDGEADDGSGGKRDGAVLPLHRLSATSDEQLLVQRRESARKEQRNSLTRKPHSVDSTPGDTPRSTRSSIGSVYSAQRVLVHSNAYDHSDGDDDGNGDDDDDDDDVDSIGGDFDAFGAQDGFGELRSPAASSTGSASGSRRGSSGAGGSSLLERRRRSSSMSRLPTLAEDEVLDLIETPSDTDLPPPASSDTTVVSPRLAGPAGAGVDTGVIGGMEVIISNSRNGSANASRRGSSANNPASPLLHGEGGGMLGPTSPPSASTATGDAAVGLLNATSPILSPSAGGGGERLPRSARGGSVTNMTKSMRRKKGMDALDLASSMRAFGAATTSVKPAHVIVHELKQALKACDIMFEELNPVKLRCTGVSHTGEQYSPVARRSSLINVENIVWEITVQVLPHLNMRGIHLKRVKGNHWEYKKLVDEVIRKAKL